MTTKELYKQITVWSVNFPQLFLVIGALIGMIIVIITEQWLWFILAPLSMLIGEVVYCLINN